MLMVACPRRIAWARLLARVFALDVTRYRTCGVDTVHAPACHALYRASPPLCRPAIAASGRGLADADTPIGDPRHRPARVAVLPRGDDPRPRVAD